MRWTMNGSVSWLKSFAIAAVAISVGLLVQAFWTFPWLDPITAGNIAVIATAILLLVVCNDP